MGKVEHLIEVIEVSKVSAVAIADVLHYDRLSLQAMRNAAIDGGIHVRTL